MFLYALTVFLSAFLLFQVQPMIAKMILPWFGGTAAVWTTCMLFFQIVLLAGYAYAHWSIRSLKPATQAYLHSGLLVASLVLLPITPGAGWKPVGGDLPLVKILLLLTTCVGLPYMLLSTTSPLIQAWYTRAGRGVVPYRLFALSNLGSMLALLSYPTLVEPWLPTRMQGTVWSVAYGLFAAVCIVTAMKSRAGAPAPVEGESIVEEAEPGPAPGWGIQLLWIGLAACPSALLLSVTNHLTEDVAAIPFLWVLPLTLYLLTFILCFDARGWYRRAVFYPLLVPALGGMAYLLFKGDGTEMKIAIPAYAAAFFVACMVCHGELSNRKPHPKYLTTFYVMLSVGGAIGGLFVGLLAPVAFPVYIEFPISIAMVGVLALVVVLTDKHSQFYHEWWSPGTIVMFSAVLSLMIFLGRTVHASVQDYRVITRNFYGGLRVRQSGKPEEMDSYRVLLHGSINHGEQFLNVERRKQAISYYCPQSGVGCAIKALPEGPRRVGVLGLGAGSLAAYGRAGDYYRYYDINPTVEKLARSEFWYLSDTKAKLDVALGDARLSLEAEPDQNFDLLVIDVFSGDSIPVHLLTKEAFGLYFRHLKPDGILAVHVSNKYLNLPPVVEKAAVTLKKASVMVDTDEDEEATCFGCTWILLSGDTTRFEKKDFCAGSAPVPYQAGLRMWTDDYSNLFQILK